MSANRDFFKTDGSLKPSTACALFFALSVLFVASNYGAYRSYFQDDEFDNLSWAPFVPGIDYVRALLSPLFQLHNFRPAAEFYFHVMGQWFGLDFPKYIAPIHAIHLLNVSLLWFLPTRL